MIRILLMLGVLIIIVGGVIAILARMNVGNVNKTVATQMNKVLPDQVTSAVTGTPQELPAEPTLTKGDLMPILEASISALNSRIDDLAAKQQTSPVVTDLESSPTPAPTTTSGPKTIYLPVGYGGSGTTTDYSNIAGEEITIDPADYPGYKDMVFEVSARIFQGNGTAYIRLGNKSDGTSILNSTISTTSSNYTQLTSSTFTLSSKSTYVVQTKSTTGYSVDLQLTRIRVDF